MTYLFLKSLHIVAVILWMGGMVLLSVASLWLAKAGCPRGERESSVISAVRRWDARVTNPALGLVWLFGITIAYLGDWYMDAWLHAKFVVVLVLSALHGNLTASFRRMENDPARPVPNHLPYSAAITFGGLLVIVLLVVMKPF
ncbi:putative membrane protein [Pararhizobium capsulatum DSM 1112]|uniref:Protoporphyrinogen IX oxidase n=1 Tax=Pararhizobium capsulatum DSM 1112 TaxID=1121113 RepID=A0ABU0BPJ5_9HYPH|nr:CopD family protein [Pararhizobium capsulatum]MDQ0319385.1 putative membrane protein [Pararhizobium capsulatum DSM 1112]